MDGKPKGGKWSYDNENRKKIPSGLKSPPLIKIKQTLHTSNLKKIINNKFSSNPGDVKYFWFPTTHKEAEKWLDFFLIKSIIFSSYIEPLKLAVAWGFFWYSCKLTRGESLNCVILFNK